MYVFYKVDEVTDRKEHDNLSKIVIYSNIYYFPESSHINSDAEAQAKVGDCRCPMLYRRELKTKKRLVIMMIFVTCTNIFCYTSVQRRRPRMSACKYEHFGTMNSTSIRKE